MGKIQNYKLIPNIVSLANCKLLDENGAEVPIYKLWQAETRVFIFLRHFGCIGCRAHAKQIWADRAKYEMHGARLAFIGNGSPHFIEKFKKDLGIENAPIYTDPSLEVFRSAGFKRGFLAALGPKSIANGVKLMVENQSGTAIVPQGDLWQLGGVLVVRPSGKIPYFYISESLGDYPPEKDFEDIE